MKKKLLAIVSAVCLSIMAAAPAAYAEESAAGSKDTTLRIEAEDYVKNRSSNENKGVKSDGANGETYLDDMREGQVFCLAHDIDLTGLQAVDLSLAHSGGGAVYALYIDGTKNALGTKIAEAKIASTGDWQKFQLQSLPLTADATPARLSGTHDLFLRVETAPAGSLFCGNFDATVLTFGAYSDPLETVQIEAETFTEKIGSGGVKEVSGFSGGKDIDGTRNGSVFAFGEFDLTGLQSFSIAVGCQGDNRSYDLYIDGTVNEPALLVAKAVAAKGSGNWNTVKTFEAAVQVDAEQVKGVHKVFLKTNYDTNPTGTDYTGNIDYFTLTKYRQNMTETVFEMENIKDNADNRSNNTRSSTADDGASGGKFLDGTAAGDVFYLGDYDTTDLQQLALSVASASGGTVYGFYIDGTAKAACENSYKIAELTGQYTDGAWRKFTEFSTGLLPTVSRARLQGIHSLFLKVESSENPLNYGGNMDYVKITCIKPAFNPVSVAKTYNFGHALNASLSSTSGFGKGRIKITEAGADSEYSDVYGVIDSKSGIQLAYSSVNFSRLKGIAVRYMVAGATDLKLYKGSVDDAHLVKTLAMDVTRFSGTNQWYTVDNLRTSYFDLSDLATSGADTLYFVPETTSTYAGNYIDFTLYYEEELESNHIDTCTVEGEQYVWGASDNNSNWPNATKIDGTKNGDTFYLGKANIDNLQAIAVRAATAHLSNITYTLYADMDVAWGDLTATGVRDQYIPTAALTGGVELGRMTISAGMVSGSNNWNIWDTFSCDVSPETLAALGSGEHEIYLKLTRDINDFTGNIDHIRLIGLKPGSVDTFSNMIGDAAVVGGGSITYPDNPVYGATTSLTAEADEGYTLAGWNHNGVWVPAGGNSLADVPVDAGRSVTAYFVQTDSEKAAVFYGKGNKLFDVQVVTDLASVHTALAAAREKAPDIYGYEFYEWSETDDSLLASLDADNPAFSITAYYRQNDKQLYDIHAVNAASITQAGSPSAGSDFKASFDTRITVTAAANDAVLGDFAYWLLDDMVVGFDETYTFYVSGDNTIKAVYTTMPEYDPQETADAARVMVKKAYITAEKDRPGTNKLTVIPQVYAPKDAEIVEYGVYFAPGNTSTLADIANQTGSYTEGKDYIKVAASSKVPNRQYMINLRHVADGRVRQAMAYVTMKTASGDVTTYSSIQTYTVTLPTV